MVWTFWAAALVVAYVYVVYPLLLAAWAAWRRRPLARPPAGRALPGVSIVIAARNEGPRLPARLDNLLGLDYPADRRQIIVVSDGSTDDTLDRLSAYRHEVELVDVPAGGKALALNAGVARARFDIVAFADARQTFAPDALAELAAPFADPAVGAVTGELVLDAEPAAGHACASTIGDGLGLYWRYEKQLRRLESAVWSALGATGAIYAIRRSLWQPLPAGTVLDDVLAPMRCVLAGRRVVVNERALAWDRTAPDADAEGRRKVRTLAGNFQILALEPRLLIPWRNPVWLQYVSHKLGRLVVPYALLVLFAASITAAPLGPVYTAALAAQSAFYLLAGYGAWLDHRTRLAARSTSAPAAPWPVRTARANGSAVNA